MKITGGCLCGEIAFEIAGPLDEFGHCYCTRCRKATGSDRSSVLVTTPDQLKWTQGEGKAQRWDMPSATSFATSFCPSCGSPLPRLTRDGNFAVIPAGSIDSELPVMPQFHEHYASRANWICLDESELRIYPGEAG